MNEILKGIEYREVPIFVQSDGDLKAFQLSIIQNDEKLYEIIWHKTKTKTTTNNNKLKYPRLSYSPGLYWDIIVSDLKFNWVKLKVIFPKLFITIAWNKDSRPLHRCQMEMREQNIYPCRKNGTIQTSTCMDLIHGKCIYCLHYRLV